MTDYEATPFDDELLSAYLDDELAPAERARVDERLASDPQAQRLLNELKAVSRAMKELPAATLDADLSESVLRRAERAMLLSDERASARGPDERPWRLPFGRSKRSWFWAGAALAAGLLLMVYDGRDEREEGLPNQVALRRGELATERAPLAMRSVDELPDVSVDLAVEAPAPPLDPVASQPEVLAKRESTSGPESGSIGTTDPATEFSDAAAFAGDDLVVVHVNVKPDALKNRTFDALLFRNNIEVERPTSDDTQATASGDVDVVLVEADPYRLVRCMDALEADDKNYLDIEVDEPSAAKQRGRAASEPAKSLQKYNRGVVPSRQKIAFAPNRDLYFESAREQSSIAGTLADNVEESPRSQDLLSRSSGISGRATRMNAAASAERSRAESISGVPTTATPMAAGGVGGAQVPVAASPDSTATPDASSSESIRYFGEAAQNTVRRGVQKLATKADMLQVLFVLSAEQPAPSEPTSTPTPTTPPSDDQVR